MHQKKRLTALFLAISITVPNGVFASSYTLFRAAEIKNDSVSFNQGHFGELSPKECSLSTYACAEVNVIKTESPVGDFSTSSDQVRVIQNSTKNLTLVEYATTTPKGVVNSYKLFERKDTTWSNGTLISLPFTLGDIIWDTTGNSVVFIDKVASKGTYQAVLYTLKTNAQTPFWFDSLGNNKKLSPDGTTFTYYLPALTNETKTKAMVMWRLQNNKMVESRFEYTVPEAWELNLDVNRLSHFSPSGERFAFIEDKSGYQHIRLVPNRTTAIADALPVTWPELNTVADLFFVDEATLLIVANTISNPYDWSLYEYTIKTKSSKKVVSDVSIMYPLEATPNGGVFFARTDGPNMKPVVYFPNTNSLKNFTGLEVAKDTYQHEEKIIRFDDGMSGVLITKNNSDKAKDQPVIVWLHGGPYRQTNTGFHSYPSYATYDWALQEMVEAGAHVLKLDYPGSYGYGNEYAYSILRHNGSIEPKAIMKALKEVQSAKKFSGDVYIMGNSYGGYLAPKLLTQYPKQIKGAIAINGVYEWQTLLDTLQTSIFNIHFGGLYDARTNKKTYQVASITNNLKKLSKQDEILLVTSTADKTINPEQAYTFYDLLKKKKKSVEHVLLKDESHVLTRVDSNETLCSEVFQFIDLRKFSGACTLN